MSAKRKQPPSSPKKTMTNPPIPSLSSPQDQSHQLSPQATLQTATRLFQQGQLSKSLDLIQSYITQTTTNDKSTSNLFILYLTIIGRDPTLIPIDGAAKRETELWRIVTRRFGSVESVPGSVVAAFIATIHRFTPQNLSYGQRLIEDWISTRSDTYFTQTNIQKDYKAVIEAYVLVVLPGLEDFASAEEFLKWNEVLSGPDKKDLEERVQEAKRAWNERKSAEKKKREEEEEKGNGMKANAETNKITEVNAEYVVKDKDDGGANVSAEASSGATNAATLSTTPSTTVATTNGSSSAVQSRSTNSSTSSRSQKSQLEIFLRRILRAILPYLDLWPIVVILLMTVIGYRNRNGLGRTPLGRVLLLIFDKVSAAVRMGLNTKF